MGQNKFRKSTIFLILPILASFLPASFPGVLAQTPDLVKSSYDSALSEDEAATQIDPLRNFTITHIEPGLKNRSLKITFSEICGISVLRQSLKIFPPVRINWHRSRQTDNIVDLKGAFKPGQKYQIAISPEAECRGRTYVQTVKTFQMPDLPPMVKFADEKAVIERDSRQMLHAEVVNIDELIFKGLQVPPLLLSAAIDLQLKNTPFSIARQQIEAKFTQMRQVAGQHRDLLPFMKPLIRDRQLFLPGGTSNVKDTVSMPLGFRNHKEKGAVELISLQGRRAGRSVASGLKLLRITDIGLTYKVSESSLLVWATSLRTGNPLKGIQLLAVAAGSAAVPLGKTDQDGILAVSDGDDRSQIFLNDSGDSGVKPIELEHIRLLIAVSDDDCTYIIVHPKGNIKPDWLAQPKAYNRDGRLLKGHVFTERGIYRPGDIVHFKGTLREFAEDAIAPPRGIKPEFVIINSKDEPVFSKELDLSEYGTATDSFQIKPFFPLGTYTVQMKFGKGPEGSASRTFQVQEFRPPRHFTEIHFEPQTRLDDSYVNLKKEVELLNCEIGSVYYAGGPVKHGKVRWKIYYTRTDFPQARYPEYRFGNFIQKRSELLESGESILDEAGKLTVTIPMGPAVSAGMYGLEVVASVVDFDGRVATETATYQKKPAYLIGVRSHPEKVDAGASQVLDLVVLDVKGEPLASGELAVDVMRKDHIYVKKRNEVGNVFWDWQEAWQKQVSSTLAISKGRARFEFDFAWGGQYLLKFIYTDRKGRKVSSSTVYNVEGYFYGYEYQNRQRNFEKFSILPEKKEYAPGQTLKLYLHPHRKLTRVLMTIERDAIFEHRVIKLNPGQRTIEIPVKESYIPNVYITLLGIVARGDFPVYTGEFDSEAPTFLFGAADIEVRKDVRDLDIAINPKDQHLKAEPGATVHLNLMVSDPSDQGVESEVALCVVDESVLALTGFKTPTLEALTRFSGPLAVFTGELRAELLKQTPFGFVGNEPVTGGGGLNKSPTAATTKIRKDFRPVAYFNPAVHTDADGRAAVSFTVPDTMTTYRVYAVACDKGSRFASKDRGLLVVKDFYLEPGLPRFFTKDDHFRFAVSVFNKTDRSGDVSFAVDHNQQLDLQTSGQNLKLQGFDRSLMAVEGRALKPGVAQADFSGRFQGMDDAIALKIPVNSGHLLWNDIVFGTVNGSQTIHYRFPSGTEKITFDELNPDEVQAVLTVSGSPFLRMGKGLKYLLRYPYGCVEQTSSGVIPLAALRGLVKDERIPNITIDETDKFLKSGVERLLSMQTESGGFGYWPGNIHPHKWGSVYAVSALSYAARAGFDVPAEKMNKALAYLQTALQEDSKDDLNFKAFALYLLALNLDLEERMFRGAFGDIEKYPRQGALMILLAGKICGYADDNTLKELAREVLERRWAWKGEEIFYARYREPAIALMAASAIMPKDPITGRLAKRLLGGVNKQGIWTSTSDTGWSLVALGDYFKEKSFGDQTVTVRFQPFGGPETTVSLPPNGFHAFGIDAKRFIQKPQFQLATDQDRDVVYMLSLTFPRVDYAASGYSNGFKIQKSIENSDGSKTIKLGDIVRVILDIDIDNHRYRHLVLDDPLPAGLVAINSALKTEEAVEPVQTVDDGDYHWSHWDYETGTYRFVPNFFEIRDDRVLVFKDRAWRGRYRYTYYARAVCEGEFVLPSSKIQLMYEPEVVSFTPVSKVIIEGR
jgi:uncharacterized protein YfaS (alpha-2-macroglobulin family)